MSLEIVEVDPRDEAAFRRFYDVYVGCGRYDAASFVATPYEHLFSIARTPTEDFAFTAFLAVDAGVTVGHGWYAGHLRTDLDQAHPTPRVLPEYRRRGYGTAILRHMEAFARSEGRRRLMASTRWPTEFGPDGIGAAGPEFARRHGYGLALVEMYRRLALPVDVERLDEFARRADPAYTIRAFSGPVPDDLVEGWAALEASLPTEAPTGDLEIDEAPPSVASVRADERVLAESGQVKFNAVALAPDGEPVGYTDMVVSPGEPAEQWGTLVRRAHRGHGLGYALKAAVIRLLQQERPEVAATITSNALDNAAMVAVNDALGYEVLNYVCDVQKRLG